MSCFSNTSQQDSFFQRQPSGLMAQMPDHRADQFPTYILPHSLLPRVRGVPDGTSFPTQHLYMSQQSSGPYFGFPIIPGHDFPKLGGPRPVMLPESNAPGEKQESLCGTATLDLDGFSIPFLTKARSCGLLLQASPVTSPLPTSPSSSLQVVQKQSRLPTSTAGRKAPRKSTIAPTWPIKSSNEVMKGKKRSITPCLTKQTTIPNSARSSSCSDKETSRKSSSRLTQSASAIPRPVSFKTSVASNQNNRAVACSTPQSRRVALKEDHNASIPGSATEVQNEQEKISLYPQITTRGQVRATRQQIRPQPRYKYDVPPELECVRRALGQDDWTEYLVLVEKHALREVTEKTYNTMSRRMYYVINTTLRKKIETMVIKRMIGPVIGHRDNSKEATIEMDQSSKNFQTTFSVKKEECSCTLSTPSSASHSD